MISSSNNSRDVKTTNADDNRAFRVVITNPGPDDTSGPINLLITSDNIDTGANVGSVVGYLVPDGGVGPFLFTISDDPDDKFAILDNALITDNPVDYFTQPQHSVTIKVTDINNKEFSKAFIIDINQTPAAPFINTKAVTYNGTDQHTEAPYDASFSGLAEFSASMWVTPTTLTGETCVLSEFGANGKRAYRFNITTGGKLNIFISGNGVAQESFTGTLDVLTGVKTHIAFAFDGTNQTIKTWVNSAEDIDDVTVITSLFDTSDEPLRAGARGDTTLPETAFYDGLIDELSIYNFPLTTLRTQELYNFGTPANVANMTSSSSLISWWRMGDGDTYPTLTDQVASNDMSMENMAAANIVNFDFNNMYSLNFNGVDEYISTPVDLSGLDQFTIAAWFYRLTTGERLDVSQSNLANSSRVKIVRNSNGSIYAVVDGVNMQHVSNNTGWEMIVLAYDGTKVTNADRVKMYRNGSILTPGAVPTWPASISSIDRDLNIGLDDGSMVYSEGNIDEVSIWDKQLSPAEVTELYNSGAALDLDSHSAAANLLNWYRCGDALNSPTMPDQGPSAQDATLVNMDATNRDTEIPT